MDHDVHIADRLAGGGIGFEKRLEERFGGLDALLLVAASEPSEIEKHRVVMDKTDRQVEHPFPDVFIIDIEGKLTLRRIGNICVGVIPEKVFNTHAKLYGLKKINTPFPLPQFSIYASSRKETSTHKILAPILAELQAPPGPENLEGHL